MGRSCFFIVLLISVLLAHSFSQEYGRKVMASFEEEASTVLLEENSEKAREIMDLMDYKDPGPNTNPKTGFLLSPPPKG